jgi:transcription elongation GreA/GreB family factor
LEGLAHPELLAVSVTSICLGTAPYALLRYIGSLSPQSHQTLEKFILSVAFTKEESAETASETLLPDRPISSNPNLVTETGLRALERQFREAQQAYEAAQKIEDVNEKRRLSANPLRDIRYFSERLRTAQVVPNRSSPGAVAFGCTVTFSRTDGRVQKYRTERTKQIQKRARSHLHLPWRKV